LRQGLEPLHTDLAAVIAGDYLFLIIAQGENPSLSGAR